MKHSHTTQASTNNPHHAPSSPRDCRLDEVPSGWHGVVHRVEGADVALERLMAMGLCEGREVEVVRRGNPLVVRFLGSRVGVSKRLARQIQVAPRGPGRCDRDGATPVGGSGSGRTEETIATRAGEGQEFSMQG